MYRNDYRTGWQREDDNAAIDALDALEGRNSEQDHELAVDVLLGRVHPDVADAYKRLQDRTKQFWATV